jgi:hypothetical protein
MIYEMFNRIYRVVLSNESDKIYDWATQKAWLLHMCYDSFK